MSDNTDNEIQEWMNAPMGRLDSKGQSCGRCRALDLVIAEKEKENEELKESEKSLSDAYLRIRELVGAWDTQHGGMDRFDVTENKVRELKLWVKKAVDALIWMSGSSDFGSDGQAFEGYKKIVSPLISSAPRVE